MRHLRLTVPHPAEPPRLDRFLAANLPELGGARIQALLTERKVRVGGQVETRGDRTLRPRESVDLVFHPSMLPAPAIWSGDRILLEGPGFYAIDKPTGVLTHRDEVHGVGVAELLAPVVDRPAEDLKPAHRLDRETSGVLLVAVDRDTARELSQLFAEREIRKQYRAVVSPAPVKEADSAQQHDDRGRPMTIRWEVVARSRDGRRADLLVEPKEGRTHQVRLLLAGMGCPIVGDLEHGRPLPGGATRLALHSWRAAWDDLKVEAPLPNAWAHLLDPPQKRPPVPSPTPTGGDRSRPTGRRTLRISAATKRILAAGHPWVVADRETGDLVGLSSGDIVDLVDAGGYFVATAILDPDRPLCARTLGTDPNERLDDSAFAIRAGEAVRRRQSIHGSEGTDALRLIHGEADGLPGLSLDRWGPLLVATLSAPSAERFLEPAIRAADQALGELGVWVQHHFTDLRRSGGAGARVEGRWWRPGEIPSPWQVTERGLRFLVEPLGTLSTGLYPDQRDNRQRLTPRLAGRSLLNLFGHTGAWSVGALAAGATLACTVDLAPRWLTRAEENVALNDLDPSRHRVVAQSVGRFLAEDTGIWDAAIVDPPSFAKGRAGDGDWSTRRDLPALLDALMPRLSQGALLLVTVNTKDVPDSWLRDTIALSWRRAGRGAVQLRRADPSVDFPTKKGFPEGRAFIGVLAEPGGAVS